MNELKEKFHGTPRNEVEVIAWFKTTKQLLNVLDEAGKPHEWFHGIIRRPKSEKLLMKKPVGYFLIRVNGSRFGYSISIRAMEKCKHYLIAFTASGRPYIMGEKISHQSLDSLVKYHAKSGLLYKACGQEEGKCDYLDIISSYDRSQVSSAIDAFITNNTEAYLKACAEGEAAVTRWKLMVLGMSGDGKTSLINRLLGKGFTEEHFVTNALETDCKVEITHCDREWEEYKNDHLDLLDDSVTQCIGHYINSVNINETSPETTRPNLENKAAFDEITDQEERDEAKHRLKRIFSENVATENPMRYSKKDSSLDKGASDFLKFILSIWDLGGQVVYYILHHIFLRCHCLHILVVNLSRPLYSQVPSHELPPHTRQTTMMYFQSIEFWLNMLLSHMVEEQNNKDLPHILLVGTHKDLLHENPKERDRLAAKYFKELQSLLLKKASFSRVHSEFISVDSKGGDPENYAKLRKLVLNLTEKHCSEAKFRPIKWLNLEKKLHSLKNDKSLTDLEQNLISYDRLIFYAKQFHIDTQEEMDMFLNYHHLTGDMTFIPGLKDYIVPHPQWLVNVFRAVITLDTFYPKSQKHVQEMGQLRNEGILKANSSLLNEIWKPFLAGDSGAAKQYLLNLMVEFQLAVKYESDQYIIPCLLQVCPSPDFPVLNNPVANLPTLYYKFHSSADSYAEVRQGAEAYDNFLPHGLFQKLIAKCSGHGWAWTDQRYQDFIVFTSADILISLQAKSNWIALNVNALNQGVALDYYRYQSLIALSINQLLSQYHPNMWFELAVNPCSKVSQECLLSIGSTSLDKGCPVPRGVTCSQHLCSFTTAEFKMWLAPGLCRVLTEKDLKKVGDRLTDHDKQLTVALELNVPSAEVIAINHDNQEIQVASFKVLRLWYNQQINKVDAFNLLCDALEKSELSGLVEPCLFDT